jgi:hypothetical protein
MKNKETKEVHSISSIEGKRIMEMAKIKANDNLDNNIVYWWVDKDLTLNFVEIKGDNVIWIH